MQQIADVEAYEQPGGPEAAWRSGQATAGDLADRLAARHRLPRLAAADLARMTPLMRDLSRRFLREHHLVPMQRADGGRLLVVADPARAEAVAAVALALGGALPLAVAPFDDVERLFEHGDDEPARTVAEDAPTLEDSVETLEDLARGAPVVRTIDRLLERAVEVGATDIHLETEKLELRVRLRVDGMLRSEKPLPRHLAPAVISRVKILAGLDIAERRLPQDGRANVRVGTVETDLRVAVMPTMHGETAVIRILVKDSRLLEFSRVGIGGRDREIMMRLLAEPHGIVIVTGPTGSGKTTTLATAIGVLNDPRRKIVTIEDPVEYQIAGVHQTQVRPQIGVTFATALRAFLRHDPDVIMVGEMRDRETAGIGIQAALTGHLVLTTLHTNTAADAIVRLVDMGVEPYLIGATLRGVVGQRLVRKLCERCKAADGELGDLALRSKSVRPEAMAYKAVGCEACGGTGYRGRIGIFEVFVVDELMRALIKAAPDPGRLVEQARAGGMTTMLDDGLAKVAAGITTVDDVLRMTG